MKALYNVGMTEQSRERRQARRRRTEQISEPQGMPPDHVGILVAGFFMMIGGWAGLAWLVQTQPVGLGPQIWAFFMLLHIAITGTVLPLVRIVNVRFTRVDVDLPPGGVIVRQSAWIGLFVVICAWFQIPRALSLPVVFFVGLVFLVLEAFIRSRELNADEE